MRNSQWKTPTLILALALAAVGTASLHAQDHPDQRDQGSAPSHSAPPARSSHGGAAPTHGARPNEGHAAQPAVADRGRGGDQDSAASLRRAHPGAAARCHDGFFTRTTDRRRACSKHGGIEVWLLL